MAKRTRARVRGVVLLYGSHTSECNNTGKNCRTCATTTNLHLANPRLVAVSLRRALVDFGTVVFLDSLNG